MRIILFLMSFIIASSLHATNSFSDSCQVTVSMQGFTYLYISQNLNMKARGVMLPGGSIVWQAEDSVQVAYANYSGFDHYKIVLGFQNGQGEQAFNMKTDKLLADFSQFSDSSRSFSAADVDLITLNSGTVNVVTNIKNNTSYSRNLYLKFVSTRKMNKEKQLLKGNVIVTILAD